MNVALMVNGKEVGRAQRKSHFSNEWETLALQSTMDLKAGDQVWLQILVLSSIILHDESYHFTHFNGWILQEYISPWLIINSLPYNIFLSRWKVKTQINVAGNKSINFFLWD
jgi:hypothetical protein